MGFFKGLTNLATAVVSAPIALTADALTMGGQLNDRHKSYTASTLEKAERAVDDMTEDEWDE